MTDYGTIETLDDGRYVLRYERQLRHPVEKVWEALTDPAQVEEWWARAEVELAEGGRARLEWLNGDAVAEGRVTRLEPPRTIEFDTDIHGRLLWELRPDGDGTRLTLTVTAELPDDYLASVRAGWHMPPRLPRGRARRPPGRLAELAASDAGRSTTPSTRRACGPSAERCRASTAAR